MSDGPYKSLNMARGWKELAKRAAAKSFAPDEVSIAVPIALHQDWVSEAQPAFKLAKKRLLSGQNSLFSDSIVTEIMSLRTDFAGSPLSCLFLDHLAISVSNGRSGSDALLDATTKTLLERASRGGRQVEEHYARETSQKHAAAVRGQIENAIGRADISGLAKRIVNEDGKGPAVKSAQKHGLDDGASLP